MEIEIIDLHPSTSDKIIEFVSFKIHHNAEKWQFFGMYQVKDGKFGKFISPGIMPNYDKSSEKQWIPRYDQPGFSKVLKDVLNKYEEYKKGKEISDDYQHDIEQEEVPF